MNLDEAELLKRLNFKVQLKNEQVVPWQSTGKTFDHRCNKLWHSVYDHNISLFQNLTNCYQIGHPLDVLDNIQITKFNARSFFTFTINLTPKSSMKIFWNVLWGHPLDKFPVRNWKFIRSARLFRAFLIC